MTKKTDREIAEAATPGPWRYARSIAEIGIWSPDKKPIIWPTVDRGLTGNFEDAEFIAHFSPSKVLGMLDEIARLKTELAERTRERDEEREARKSAQREMCEGVAVLECPTHPSAVRGREIAREFGWDCFEIEGDDDA